MRGLAWLVMVVVGGAGCATSKWGTATTAAQEQFPKRDELMQLASKAPKLDTAKHDAVAVDAWTLVGPFPSAATLTKTKPATVWEQAVVAAHPHQAEMLAADQQCIAREAARFLALRGAFPGRSLQTFMERRCGTLATQVLVRGVSGTVPVDYDETKWLAAWKANVEQAAKADGTMDVLGVAAFREGDKAAFVVATGRLGSELQRPIALLSPGASVIVRGKLSHGTAKRIDAAINVGPVDTRACKALDAVRPPEFAFECAVEASDARTTLEVAAYEEGRLLGRDVLTVTLWPQGNASATWERPRGATEVAEADFDSQFLSAVNVLRANAKLPMLSLSKAQSATATMLAPHYYASVFGEEDPRLADVIAMGMLAGWDVGIDIVSGDFGSMWLSGSRDLGQFVEGVLDSPFARQSITNPRATQLAVGSLKGINSSLAAIYGTYVPLGTFDRKEAEIALVTRLNQQRVDKKLDAAQWTLWPADEGAYVEQALAARKMNPEEGLQYVLERTAAVSQTEVSGYVQQVDELEKLQFPPELLERPDINVFVTVGVYRGEDWAHSRYVVFFAATSRKAVETASR
jgi:uncharacterized protein YkwD